MNFKHLTIFALLAATPLLGQAETKLTHEVARKAVRPVGAPDYADVRFRYGWVRNGSFPTVDDAKQAMADFHATRLDWFYPGSHNRALSQTRNVETRREGDWIVAEIPALAPWGVLVVSGGKSATPTAKPFQPGERVVFLGDSITHYGTWWPSVWCAYVERSPRNPPLFFNAGYSGDRASRALGRLDRDVFSLKPDTVCVMFGMNDVPSSHQGALENYRKSMDQLLRRITKEGLRCIVITPSPYDQTMVNPEARKLHPGRNDALAQASNIAAELAQKHRCELVDFHGPMTRMNVERQSKDPASSIIGLDRIHPGAEGAKVMAKLFLDAQGVSADAVNRPDSFPDVWAHVNLERNRRNMIWLTQEKLAPRGIGPNDIEAAKAYLSETYQPTGAADQERVQSYLKWAARDEDFARELKTIQERLQQGKTALPRVLIFGDSISGGYSKFLIQALEGKAEVIKLGSVATYRINEQAFWRGSGKSKSLDFGSAKACVADFDRFKKHLDEVRYDVIHFNFGLNDSFRGRGGKWHNPVEQYAKDLDRIVQLLKTNGAKIIWSNTTPIPVKDPQRPAGDDLLYNAAAAKVMKAHGIPINDLHSVVTRWDGYEKWRQGGDVHFSAAVSAMLSRDIAEVIEAQLKTP